MTLLRKADIGVGNPGAFSLYFLSHLKYSPDSSKPLSEATLPDSTSPEASEYIKNMFEPVIELTHNHGTESDANFKCVYLEKCVLLRFLKLCCVLQIPQW